QEAVQGKHRCSRSALNDVGIVMKVGIFLYKISFALLVRKLPYGCCRESDKSYISSHPKLDRRRLFRIEAKLPGLNVGRTRTNVISLVVGEAVKAGSDR